MLESAQPARDRPPYPIESVDNALRLLGLLHTRGSITVSDASESLGVARSTAHRLLAMLRYHGFVRQDPSTKVYLAGRALLEIGLSAVANLDVRSAARPALEDLSRELEATVHLAVLDGTDILFVDSVESETTIRVSSRIGIVMPAACTAAGKALLAELPSDELRNRLGRRPLKRMTERSIESLEALEGELSMVHERGYATNFGESEQGLSAVAVAIREQGRLPRASITVSVPAERLPRARVVGLAGAARRSADRVVSDLLRVPPGRATRATRSGALEIETRT